MAEVDASGGPIRCCVRLGRGDVQSLKHLNCVADRNLYRSSDRSHRPVWQMLGDLPRQSINPLFRIGDRVNVILQHDLLCRMIKAHRRQPAAISLRPGPSSTVSELFVGPSLRKILIWRAFIFGGTDSKRARDAK